MKIYCNKSELYRALNNAIQAVPSRSTSKILEGVLIETKEDELIITGTDTFMVVESKLSAKCDGIANFVDIANIIGKLPSEDVMMEYDSVKRVLSIQSGRYRSEVICFDSTEFPKVQMKEPQKSITLNKESVRKLIRKTASLPAQMKSMEFLPASSAKSATAISAWLRWMPSEWQSTTNRWRIPSIRLRWSFPQNSLTKCQKSFPMTEMKPSAWSW